MTQTEHKPGPDLYKMSLGSPYGIVVGAIFAGSLVVAALNIATPLEVFSLERERLIRASIRMLASIPVILLCPWLVLRWLCRPISEYLRHLGSGIRASKDLELLAKRRLLNMPFVLAAVNVVCWIVIPAGFALLVYLAGDLDPQILLLLLSRACMVGLISSSVLFFLIEAHCRHRVAPMVFPRGGMVGLKGAARLSISLRIGLLFTTSTLLPMIILVATLFSLQWEGDFEHLTPQEYGRGILVFSLVLAGWISLGALRLNRLVSNSITEPIGNMMEVVGKIQSGDYGTRIKVVSNDELGVLGRAANAMVKGLGEREQLHAAFGKYVTPEIRDEIISGNIPLSGQRLEATVLFSDIRGFTPYVEENPSEEVIASMREYFTAMHRAIVSYQGIVLQFVGDGIEAVFGAPAHYDGHPDHAVRAAMAMRRALRDVNKKRRSRGQSPFRHGVGIHTGPVLAGNTGSDDQLAYALIGSTVNVASRIQDLTKEVDCDILVSRQTVKRLGGEYDLEQQAPRMVKGYSHPVVVFRVR